MVYVTTPDRDTGYRIARVILEERLAACANLLPAESMYWWEGRIEEAKEVIVIFKTRSTRVRGLIERVKGLHPYDVPCIVSYPMGTALDAYVDWIDRETARQR